MKRLNEIIVPAFSKEDFIQSTKPFEWLYQYKDNKFVLAQARELVKVQAGSVGVKGFIGLWKAYLQSVTSNNNLSLENATDFTEQSLELMTGEWTADDMGVTTLDKFGFEIVACNHPIMPVQRLINIDSDTEKLKIAYKKKGKGWRSIIVDKKTLASANSIINLAEYGIAVNSENAKYLVRYLTDIESLNCETIQEINSVGRLGWIDEHGFSPYVDNLIFDGDASFKHYFESVNRKGKYEKWFEVCKEIRQGGVIAKIMLASSFASVLVKPCNALPFFTHLWGGTEAGKTVALMLAASVWADPQMGAYIHTFNSTTVGQELSASFVNSLPLILDELQIIGDRRDFDKMIYQLSEGIGKARGSKTGGLQKVGTWQNCIITSGEQPIVGGSSAGGAVNRIIEIDCKEEKIFKNPVEVVGIIKKNYGFAGKMFVDILQDEEMYNYALEKQKEFYKVLIKGESTEKQAMAASVILTADYLINEWIFKDNQVLHISDIVPFLTTKNQVSANERAYEFIFDFIAINKNKFQSNSYGEYAGEIWGCIEFDYVYIVKSQFDKLMQNEGYNSTAFLSWAKSRNIIQCKKGRNTMIKRIDGNGCNCVCIKIRTDDSDDNMEINNFSDIENMTI